MADSPITDPAVRALLLALPGSRVVGGAVRDLLLGVVAADTDLAAPLTPQQVIQALRLAGIGFAPTGLAHGTVTAVVDGKGFEITSLRRDVATDGRRAEVEFTQDWREDAARRDFTINALSLDQAGTIHDYHGGRADLAAGRVRFVGDARARVAEDYLRILRFFRFYARYGRGPPDSDALAAIKHNIAGLNQLSAERIWRELKALLAADNPVPALLLMEQTGVLAAMLPGGFDIPRLARLGAADPLLRFAALAVDAPAYAATLRLSRSEQRQLAGFCRTEPPPPAATDDDLRRALEAHPLEDLIGASRLRGDPPALRERLQALPRPVFPLHGRDAVALGMKPGAAVGQALHAVRQWWRDHGCRPTAAECRTELARRVREGQASLLF